MIGVSNNFHGYGYGYGKEYATWNNLTVNDQTGGLHVRDNIAQNAYCSGDIYIQ